MKTIQGIEWWDHCLSYNASWAKLSSKTLLNKAAIFTVGAANEMSVVGECYVAVLTAWGIGCLSYLEGIESCSGESDADGPRTTLAVKCDSIATEGSGNDE